MSGIFDIFGGATEEEVPTTQKPAKPAPMLGTESASESVGDVSSTTELIAMKPGSSTEQLGRGDGKLLQFANIEYEVRVAADKQSDQAGSKKILHGVSGQVVGGSMLCMLGPSGSGKTSLINIIAGRVRTTKSKSHTVSGKILVDGAELTSTKFRRLSGLVTQEDVFNSSLTVQETLTFAAALKLRKHSNRAGRVDQVIASLQLEKCAKTYVGDDANPYLKGISGGEKRRLAIAMEILDPSISILLLDEPTSGLDAAAAQNVANLLRHLADTESIAVLATLHQPRNSIMNQFESVMVLGAGRIIYRGPRDRYLDYLATTLRARVPEHESAYDFLLDALNPATAKEHEGAIEVIPSDTTDSDAAANLLADVFDQSELATATGLAKGNLDAGRFSIEAMGSSESMCERCSSWLHTTKVILNRTVLVKMRDPICLMTQLSSALIMGLIFGMLYWDTYNKSQDSFVILDTQMCISMVVIMNVWLPYDVTLTFPIERRIFLRERKAGLYNTSAFYVARVLADMPAHMVSAAIMAVIVWFMAGLKIKLLDFIIINVGGILVGAAIMQSIGAFSRTFEEANIYMMVILMMSMMLGTGFVRDVPGWLDWAREVSVMGIAGDMAMYLEFKDLNPKYGTPDEIYDDYGVRITDSDDLRGATVVMLWLYVVARVVCYLCVKFLFTGRSFEENLRD